jgi:hypothetical protein
VQHNLLLIMKAPINKNWFSIKRHHANPTMAINFFMDPNMLLNVLHQIHLEIYYTPWKEGFTWWSPGATNCTIDYESHKSILPLVKKMVDFQTKGTMPIQQWQQICSWN